MNKLDFKKTGGLIPAIVQDADTGDVLMMAYMNPEAWEATQSTLKATFWSRSRQELWVKGLTSGNIQHVKEIYIDCDNDAVLLKVKQMGGAACHTAIKAVFSDGSKVNPSRSSVNLYSTRRRSIIYDITIETWHPKRESSECNHCIVQTIGMEHQCERQKLFSRN